MRRMAAVLLMALWASVSAWAATPGWVPYAAGGVLILVALLVIDALTPHSLIKEMVASLAAAFAVIDEVMVYGAMVAGVMVSQLIDPTGKRIAGGSVDWLGVLVGSMIAVPHVAYSEQGDRRGKTKSFGKMMVRYAAAFGVGFTWTTIGSFATQ